jgi:hypothetical protein
MVRLPNRRWQRFSIRTLLVAVTIVCVWLGWHWRIVQERKAVRDMVLSRRVRSPFGPRNTIVLVKPPVVIRTAPAAVLDSETDGRQ